MFDDIPRPTCRSVYTVSDKRLRHGGSGYETMCNTCTHVVGEPISDAKTALLRSCDHEIAASRLNLSKTISWEQLKVPTCM